MAFNILKQFENIISQQIVRARSDCIDLGIPDCRRFQTRNCGWIEIIAWQALAVLGSVVLMERQASYTFRYIVLTQSTRVTAERVLKNCDQDPTFGALLFRGFNTRCKPICIGCQKFIYPVGPILAFSLVVDSNSKYTLTTTTTLYHPQFLYS